MSSDSFKRNVDQKRASISWGVGALTIFLIIFYAAPTLANFKYTFEEPVTSPGTLRTERWGRDCWFTLTLGLMWLVPITALYMVAYPAKDYTRSMHVAVCVLLLIYYIVVMIIWAMEYSSANVQLASNSRNPFNDPRWCLVNYLIPGTDCIVQAPADPPVIQAMLVANGPMSFTFWMLIVFLIFLIIDLAYTQIIYQTAVRAYIHSRCGEITFSRKKSPQKEDDYKEDVEAPKNVFPTYQSAPNKEAPDDTLDAYGYTTNEYSKGRIRTKLSRHGKK